MTSLFDTYARSRQDPSNYAQEVAVDDGAVTAEVILRVHSTALVVVASSEGGSINVRFTARPTAILMPVGPGYNYLPDWEVDRILEGGSGLVSVRVLGIGQYRFFERSITGQRGFGPGFGPGLG